MCAYMTWKLSRSALWRLEAEGRWEAPNWTPDGKQLIISAGQMYVLPFAGGEPRQVMQLTPSYYHGWSPDGKTLAYCAKRGDNFDVYGIGARGWR